MTNKSYLKYFLQQNELLKIFFYFIAFFIFIILPIIKFYNVKEDYKILETHLYNNISRENVIEKKLEAAIKNKKKLKEKYQDDYLILTKKSFSSPTAVKELALKEFKANNLSLITQYRLVKEKTFESLANDKLFSYISIPYDISGNFNDFYNLILTFENHPQFLIFNLHPISIEYSKNGGVLIKFYLSSIYFLQN